MSVRCSLCSERVAREELEAHWKADLSYTPFSCRLCGFTFFSAADALRHFRYPKDTLHPHETRPQIVERRVEEVEERLEGLRAESEEAAEPSGDLASPVHDQAQSERTDEKARQDVKEAPRSQLSHCQSPCQPQDSKEPVSDAPTRDSAATQKDDKSPYQVDNDSSPLDATLENKRTPTNPITVDAESECKAERSADDTKLATEASEKVPMDPKHEEETKSNINTWLTGKPFCEQGTERKSPALLQKYTCKLCFMALSSKRLMKHAIERHGVAGPMFRCRLCPAVSRSWDRSSMELQHLRKVHKGASGDGPSLFVDLRGNPEIAAVASRVVAECFGPSFAFHDLSISDACTPRQVRWIAAAEERAAEWEREGRAWAQADAAKQDHLLPVSRNPGQKNRENISNTRKRAVVCRLCERPSSRDPRCLASHVVYSHMERKAIAACNFCSKQWDWPKSNIYGHLKSQHPSELADESDASLLSGSRFVRSLLSTEEEELVVLLVWEAFGLSVVVDGLAFRVDQVLARLRKFTNYNDEASAAEQRDKTTVTKHFLPETSKMPTKMAGKPRAYCQLCQWTGAQSINRYAGHAATHTAVRDTFRCRVCDKTWQSWMADGQVKEHLRTKHPQVARAEQLPPEAVEDLRGAPHVQGPVSAMLQRCFGLSDASAADSKPPGEKTMNIRDLRRVEGLRRLAKARHERWEAAQRTHCPYLDLPPREQPPKQKPRRRKLSECSGPASDGFATTALQVQDTKRMGPKRQTKRMDCAECGESVGKVFIRDHAVFKHLKKPTYRCRHCPYEILRWTDTSLARDHLRRKHGNPLQHGYMMEFHNLKDEALTAEVLDELRKCFPGHNFRSIRNQHRLSELDHSQLVKINSYVSHFDAAMDRYARAKAKPCRLCSLMVTETEEKNHVMLNHLDGGRAFKCKHCVHTSPYWSGDFKQLQTHMDTRHPGTGHWKKEVVDLRPELMAAVNALLPMCFGDETKLVVLSKLMGFNH